VLIVYAGALVVALVLARAVADALTAGASTQAGSWTVTARGRSMSAVTAATTALAASICVPTAFLLHELQRIAGSPVGYVPAGLHSATITLLDFEARTQQEWWHQLEAIRQGVRHLPEVREVAWMNPVPWSYRGTQNVVAGDQFMLLNVAVSRGALAVIGANLRDGTDVGDEAVSAQVVVQNVRQAQEQSFLPPGTVVAGRVEGLRFSALDETGRPAVFRPLRAGIWPTNHLVLRFHDEAQGRAAVERVLAESSQVLLAGPLTNVESILATQMQPLRSIMAVALSSAALALVLLVVVLLSAVRTYVAQTRREISIHMCLGAPPGRLALRSSSHLIVVCMLGWTAGTVVGLLAFNRIAVVFTDHRLAEPWSAWWLLPIGVSLVAFTHLGLLKHQLARIDLARGLQSA
jgi:hypothetical protein